MMMNISAKTPNMKRKSMPDTGKGKPTPSPKIKKPNEKTPGKRPNSPKNPNQTFEFTPNQHKKFTANKGGNRTPRQTPGPKPKVESAGAGLELQETKDKMELDVQEMSSPTSKGQGTPGPNESGSPKKPKMFAGTSNLQRSGGKKKAQAKKSGKQDSDEKKKRKSLFVGLKEKMNTGDKDVMDMIDKKMKGFASRKELTKSAKRKLRLLEKFKRIVSGETVAAPPTKAAPGTVSQKRRERKKNAKAKQMTNQGKQNVQTKSEKVNQQKQVRNPVTAKKQEDDEESSDYEVEAEIKPDNIIKTKEDVEMIEKEKVGDEQESNEEEEESNGEEEDSNEEEEESDEDEEDSEEEAEGAEEEDSEDESSEETKIIPENKGKTPQIKKTPDLKSLEESNISKKQKRYVLFVGNIPYDITKEDLSEHFKKAGEIRHIRIPNDKETNKPRGFAYVEFNNETSYQKGLSLHHTFIKGRRINVLYTAGGKKKGEGKKNEIKAKNWKLQAMRKQGQLAGSIKQTQKRSARRARSNIAKPVNGSNS